MASIVVSEEDLCCPVCQGLFRDPVILSCSHSFCRYCLKTFWESKGSRQCPVCRATSKHCTLNLQLRNLCENFQEQGRPREPMCKLHRSELKLFCRDDKQLICLVCRDSKLHKNHNFSPVIEAAAEYKEDLGNVEKLLQEKLDAFKKAKIDCDKGAQLVGVQAQETENQIKQEFEMLHQFLKDEEATRIAALWEEEEQKSRLIKKKKEKIEMMSREMSSLSDTIRAMEEELKADDVTFLQNYNSTVRRVQCTMQDPEKLPEGALINVAKHLGNLKFRVWEKMQEIVQYTPLILDPNTAYPELTPSKDLTSVGNDGSRNELLPNNPERCDYWHCVLGSEGFNTGTHCWDVEADESGEWFVGLLTESTSRSGRDSVWSGFWGIHIGDVGDWYFCEPRCPDKKFENIQGLNHRRVRVKLDWDRGELTFTNIDHDTLIHTFTHTFTETVFPCFGVALCSVRVVPVKPAVMVEQLSKA